MQKRKQPRKNRGRSVQELLGIRSFTRYGLLTDKGELLFFLVSPTNISVLSPVNVEGKISKLQTLLLSVPGLEFLCTDASECFDDNKAYLHQRLDTIMIYYLEININVQTLPYLYYFDFLQ